MNEKSNPLKQSFIISLSPLVIYILGMCLFPFAINSQKIFIFTALGCFMIFLYLSKRYKKISKKNKRWLFILPFSLLFLVTILFFGGDVAGLIYVLLTPLVCLLAYLYIKGYKTISIVLLLFICMMYYFQYFQIIGLIHKWVKL